VTNSIEALEEARAPELEFGFDYGGQRIWLHPILNERRKLSCLAEFRCLSGSLQEPARKVRMLHPKWGAGMQDPYTAFVQGMRRHPRKGLPAMWESCNPAIDRMTFAEWFLREWVRYLDKTTPVKVEPHCFIEPVMKPWVAAAAKPIENAEPLPEGGLFSVFKA
jgi:hypothetical protein